MARSSSGESVLNRVVRILGAFDADRPALSTSDIARRADLPVATAHRLINELVGYGLLERDARQVRVGVRMWELAARCSRAQGLRETALPFMEDLHLAVRQHTQLGVLENREVLFLERLSARGSVLNIARTAGRLPAHACSAGLVSLAHAPVEVQEDVLAADLPRFTAKTVTDVKRLRGLLADVRERGFVVCEEMITEGATGVAVPVRGVDNSVFAALSVVVPKTENHRTLVPALMASARGISRAMAWGDDQRELTTGGCLSH